MMSRSKVLGLELGALCGTCEYIEHHKRNDINVDIHSKKSNLTQRYDDQMPNLLSGSLVRPRHIREWGYNFPLNVTEEP